jgi:hypothetical protein
MVRYLEILMGADQRVSTLKASSGSLDSSVVNVLIDKLSFDLVSPIHEEDLKKRLTSAAIPFRLMKHRDGRWCVQVGAASSGLYFRLRSKTSPFVSQLITRPSAFPNFEEYLAYLKQILFEQEIQDLRLTRLDLAIDYSQPISSVLPGFDFKWKQAQVSFIDEGGQRTGVRIGKGTEKLQIYDKAIESNLPHFLTRIEIQLSGAKLPTRSLKGFQEALLQNDWNPFEIVTLSQVTFPDDLEAFTKAEQDRLRSLKPVLNREGFFAAKRHFGHQGNFQRDYLSLINIQPRAEQPASSFKRLICDFFNPIKEN